MPDKTYFKARTERSTAKQIIFALIANFSSLAPSMSLGFSAIALPALLATENPNKLDYNQASWVASIASLATPLGCFLSGPISDKFGRKSAIICVSGVSFLGWAVIALAYNALEQQYLLLLIGRLITGLSTGLASMPATVYTAEISSVKLRSVFTTWSAISFSLGVLIVYTFGYFLKEDWGTVAAAVAIFPCIAMALTLAFIPESPPWLISTGRTEEAKANMCKIFDVPAYTTAVESEIDSLLQSKEKSRKDSADFRDLGGSRVSQISRNINYFMRPTCFKPFVLILAYFFFQQFSGVFVIVFYAVDIVKEVGVTIDPYVAIVLIAFARMVSAIIVSFLSKRYGRRPLSIVSGAGVTICLVVLAAYILLVTEEHLAEEVIKTLSWLPVALLMMYFFTSTLGFLTMPFAMAAEVFPSKIRGMATGLLTCLAYSFNFVIVKMYPAMIRELGNYKLFFFYGMMGLLGTIFIVVFLPETKGKTLQEIEEYFSSSSSTRRKRKNVGDSEMGEEMIDKSIA